MQQLNKDFFIQSTVSGAALLALPERILQFGNGVLLRGLPDFYVDAANKQGVFNGRIVVVKTTPGSTDDFKKQDYLFTHRIKGFQNGQIVDETHINSSISRVLSALENWSEILDCAANPNINIVFSNTTEQGLVYVEESIGGALSPGSFPAKLLECLHHRFQKIGQLESSKIAIIPTELVENNGDKLRSFLKKLAKFNGLSANFEAWFDQNVVICNSLVDRIVPGKPEREILEQYQTELQFLDNYLIESEPFNLWAIEGTPDLGDWLSFSRCHAGIKIADDISTFKELKLRLLNATHSFSAGVALAYQLETVSEAMKHAGFQRFLTDLVADIQAAIPIEIPEAEKNKFAADVLDRFRNPNIRHYWSSIILNYSEKFNIRCLPLIRHFYLKNGRFSPAMLRGMAMYFQISIPSGKKEDGTFFTKIGELDLKLNDPMSALFYENKMRLGAAATIRRQIAEYFLPDAPAAEMEALTEALGNTNFQKILKVHPDDNLVVALQNLPAGTTVEVEGQTITLPAAVERKHKFVQDDILAQQEIRMYGVVVGKANRDLPKGTVITTANVSHKTSKVSNRQPRLDWHKPDVSKWQDKTFLGYKRSDGTVGTANYWLVFPLVFCENKNIEVIKEAISEALGYSKYHRYKAFAKQLVQDITTGQPSDTALSDFADNGFRGQNLFENVDGVRFITHTMGCGGTRQDANTLCGLLAGYLNNGNVAGATILSLGCQNAQFEILKNEIDKRNPGFEKPIFYFDQQTLGSEEKLLEAAIKATIEGLKTANECRREPAPLSKLVVGLECGGSDGFSGISANPVLGVVSDTLVALGGTAVLAEFPELCGVEQELCDRCTDDEMADRFLDLMQKYEASALQAGSSFDMNPSPGNIRDGLITDAMKSAGAAKKGGSSPVTDVLDYPEPIKKTGLNLLCTPGNDAECTTALAGSGANIILFTTGLGTPLGNPVVPVVKVSSNSALAQKMHDIIDVDAGGIIEGKASIQDVADVLMQYIIDVASGRKKTKAVLNEQYDFIPWKRGVSL